MPRTENIYSERLTVKITRHTLADLTNVATKSGEPMSAIVLQAIRNYLDGTDLTLGTRRTFDRRFEKRIAEMEASLKQGLAQSVEQAGQSLRQGMAQDTSRLQTLLHRPEGYPRRFLSQDVRQGLVHKERLGPRLGRRWPAQITIRKGSAVRFCGIAPNLIGKAICP